MKVVILDSTGWDKLPKGVSQQQFIDVALNAAEDVSKLLDIPDTLNVVIKPNLPHVREEDGLGGSAWDAELVDVTFDPKRAADDDFFSHLRAVSIMN